MAHFVNHHPTQFSFPHVVNGSLRRFFHSFALAQLAYAATSKTPWPIRSHEPIHIIFLKTIIGLQKKGLREQPRAGLRIIFMYRNVEVKMRKTKPENCALRTTVKALFHKG